MGVLDGNLDAAVQITIEPEAASQDFVQLQVAVTLQTQDPVTIVTRRSRSWQLKNTPTINDPSETEDSP